MRDLAKALAALSFLGGAGMLFFAFSTLSSYSLTNASAIQMTQVYSEGMYRALLGIGLLVMALVCVVVVYSPQEPKD